ncbi:unnamed protein product [Fraxinus pennsylvanica]|uniref:Protein kinase domain-containing protein n=1 Tax=Fraxinus pennsylvanica TaxID=56036 RepID=A0AAD1ZR70_9LAMI|nr:unnamed protein product [Fraxinus pennsylvanica]
MVLFLLSLLPLIPISFVSLMSMSASLDQFKVLHRRQFKPPLISLNAPSLSPASHGPVVTPIGLTRSRSNHHHRVRTHAISPDLSAIAGCGHTCTEPLTSEHRFTLWLCASNEKGTYLVQSQVVIIGATADSQNQGRSVVDINLVPLGVKFDNTTAILTYERLRKKKVLLNRTLFGDYEVVCITYPGLPSSSDTFGDGPSGSAGDQRDPINADFADKNQKMNPQMIFVIALSAFVLLVVCCAAVVILIKCRKSNRPSNTVDPVFTQSTNKRSGIGSMFSSNPTCSTSASLVATMPASILSVKTFTLGELEKATDKFSSKRVLGEGGFGRVYHGIMGDGTEAAIKVLTRDYQNGDQEFIAEVEMLIRLHHRNLVKLIGICIEQHTRCLVYELVPNGSVESHLHGEDKKKVPLDWDARLKIALGAARGLAYLHEDSNPCVIHRDFKASNVLLELDFTPKVSDFGLAREATEGNHHISTRVMGTFGYVAPEYAMTGHLLVKSDVYSYGVVLLELLSGRKPVDMSRPPGQENLVTWAQSLLTSREGLEQLVDPSLAGTYDFDDMAKVAAITSMCVHPEVTNRPFMGEVVQALKLIYNDPDKTFGDTCSEKESSARESDFKYDFPHSDSSWWNAGGITPRLTYGTMEYSSGPLEEFENRPFSASELVEGGVALPIRHGNRSGPLRTVRSKQALYRLQGSMSEHSGLSRRAWINGTEYEASF